MHSRRQSLPRVTLHLHLHHRISTHFRAVKHVGSRRVVLNTLFYVHREPITCRFSAGTILPPSNIVHCYGYALYIL